MSKSEAAFPHSDGAFGSAHHGMSLRDWFAGQALVGLTSNANVIDGGPTDQMKTQARYAASFAGMIADAMIAARGQS